MAIEATGVENVMEEVAHFWQLRKFQFIEEATDFWMDAVAPKACLGDEDPNLRTALTLNQFFTEWLLFEMPYQESTLVGIMALRDEISAVARTSHSDPRSPGGESDRFARGAPMGTGAGAARERCFCTTRSNGTRSIRAITFRLIHMAIMSACAVKFWASTGNIRKAVAYPNLLNRGDLGSVSPIFIC